MLSPSQDPLCELVPANRESIWAQLREQMPVYWSPTRAAWIVTRYADVSAILNHPDALALELLPFLKSICQRGKLDLSNLLSFCASLSLFTRPPHHDAIRRMLAQALGGILRLNLPAMLDRKANLLLDLGERDGVIDLAGGYGKALALFVIGSFLRIPEDDLPKLGQLSFNLVALTEGTLLSLSTLINLNQSAAVLMDYFRCLIDSRRRNPGDDGISLLVQLADKRLGCTDDELAGNCAFFFMAAEETTAAAIAGGSLILLERPALRAQLAGDPSRLPQAARELLRLVTPVQHVARQMRSNIELAGRIIRAGDRITLMLGAANRDPIAFPNPDEPQLDRSGPEPLVFAAGPYRCIGAQLATFEVELAIRKLLERPGLRLSLDAPRWADRKNIAPLQRLIAHFER